MMLATGLVLSLVCDANRMIQYVGPAIVMMSLFAAVKLMAFGLGSFVAAMTGAVWNQRWVFPVLAILSFAWPFAAVRILDRTRSDALAAQHADLAAFQQTTVQARVGDTWVSLPVAPNLGLEYDCAPPGSKRPKWCRTTFLTTMGFRLSGPEGGTLSNPPNIRSIFIHPVNQHDWCNRRADPLAANWCEILPQAEMTFVCKEDLPADPAGKDQWTAVDASAIVPAVEAEAFLLECNSKVWDGPLCRSRFMVAPQIRVTRYWRKPKMQDLPRMAAETRLVAIHIWGTITGKRPP
jgi:hypothetical protein